MKIYPLFSLLLLGCQPHIKTAAPPLPSYHAKASPSQFIQLTVRMHVNSKGVIEKAYLLKSSGQPEIDQKVLQAVRRSQLNAQLFKHRQGMTIVDQPFMLEQK